jgi:hypothetical protein
MKSNSSSVCCKNCYFRHADLCALQLSEACPTFRPYTSQAFSQQEPVRLPHRPLAEVVRRQLKVAAA